MNALLDAMRAQSPCARRLLRQYSTSFVQRVTVRGGDRRIGDMRRHLEQEEADEEAGQDPRQDTSERTERYSDRGGDQRARPWADQRADGRGGRGGRTRTPETKEGGPSGVFRPTREREPVDMFQPTARNIYADRSDRNAGRYITVLGPEHRKKYALFGALINSRLKAVLEELGPWTAEHRVYQSFGITSQGDLDRKVGVFRSKLSGSLADASLRGRVSRADNPLFWNLRNAFVRGDAAGLTKEVRYAFQSSLLRGHLPTAVTLLQESIADFRFPYEWYPATRTMQRTVHLHVGPTNSGKTYRALQALENARTGIYAGPLRLLAHEIYARFLAKGKPCALITGEEQRFPDVDAAAAAAAAAMGTATGTAADGSSGGSGSTTTTTTTTAPPANGEYFQSCTVEMTPLNKRVDVAVIDEIQMIADPERGWAWTQAFLGVQAHEVHLCGEERAVDLVRDLCGRIGDRCEVHHYERLSALRTATTSLDGDFRNLRKGDAVVSFSRVGLHTLKAGIETLTGRRCAIVYGSLPPETRAQQAALFNDPDNDYDFLVASDAIGMGLNLEIKRVVFETATKHDGLAFRHLTVPEIKQIGGRAGRYRTASQAIRDEGPAAAEEQETEPEPSEPSEPSEPASATPPPTKSGSPGYVTTLEREDLPVVRQAFQAEAPPLVVAGIQPPTFAIERFARYFPADTPFSFVLLRLRALARVSSRFQLCTPKEAVEVADIIQPFALSIADRCIFISAPCALRDPGQREVLAALARCVAEMRGGHLLDIRAIDLEILDATRDDYPLGPAQYLYRLEALHKAITLYLWLSYRYVGVFVSQALAFHVKTLVEDKITAYLETLTFVAERRQQRAQTMRKKAEQHERAEQRYLGVDAAAAAADVVSAVDEVDAVDAIEAVDAVDAVEATDAGDAVDAEPDSVGGAVAAAAAADGP